jgi:hypothetical protein
MPAFNDGIVAYIRGDYVSTPHGNDSASAQAYDRGMDYAMRVQRWVNGERPQGVSDANLDQFHC